MKTFIIYFCIILFVWPIRRAVSVEKLWLPNLEWEVASNWQRGQLPESNNRIEFPLELQHVVGLPLGTVKIAGVDLSRDGSLAFAKNGKVQINDFDKSSGRIHKWSKRGPFFWTDPKNWKYPSEAMPHLLRVPCSTDIVIFPRQHNVLSIQLPVTEVEIAGVQLLGQNFTLTRWEWWDYKKRREFLDQKFSVRYSNNMNCEGCPCQDNNQNAYLEEVCDIQRSRCGISVCQDSLKIEGHCCDFCGGRILLANNIFVPKINRIMKRVMSSYENEIDWYVRKKWNGEIEILITEKNVYTGSKTQEVVENLQSILKDENILMQKVTYSGEPVEDFNVLVILGTIFGSLFVIFLLIFIMFKSSGYSGSELLDGWFEFWYSINDIFSTKDDKNKSFNFARFENVSEGNIQLASSSSIINNGNDQAVIDNDDKLTSGGRFENPLYTSKRSKKSTNVSDTQDKTEPIKMSILQDSSDNDNTEQIEMKIEV